MQVMEQELGVPWEDVFDHIDPRAGRRHDRAGASSHARHRRPCGGEDPRPDAREQIEQDLALLEVFAEKIADRPGLRQVIDMQAVFDHLSTSLHRELDFREEAGNMARMQESIAPTLVCVPQVHGDLSTSRLLVMQDVQGGPISLAPEGPARRRPPTAARELLQADHGRRVLPRRSASGQPDVAPGRRHALLARPGHGGRGRPEMREQMMLLLMAFWQEDVPS